MKTTVRASRSSYEGSSARTLVHTGRSQLEDESARFQVQAVPDGDGLEDGPQLGERAGRIRGAAGMDREGPALVLDPDARRQVQVVDLPAGGRKSWMLRGDVTSRVAASQRSSTVVTEHDQPVDGRKAIQAGVLHRDRRRPAGDDRDRSDRPGEPTQHRCAEGSARA